MPARRSTGPPSVGSTTNSDDPEGPEVAYKIKRQRNNDAVKKSREKTNKTAAERKRHVDNLKTENISLTARIQELDKNVQCLKELLLKNVKEEDREKTLEKILAESDEDDGD